jgi:4a-hydroxytetrahydrobiopterin dehydratase
MQLADKKCTPCEGGTEPLSIEQARKLGEQIPGWEIDDKHIEKTFTFENFAQAMEFANKIAKIAEEENHHPELHISWGKVRVELYTHKIGGLSENDFVLAAKINRLITSEESEC